MFKLFSLTVHFKRPDYLTKLTRVGERRVLNVADGLKIAGIRNAEYRSLVLVGRFEFYVFDFELKRKESSQLRPTFFRATRKDLWRFRNGHIPVERRKGGPWNRPRRSVFESLQDWNKIRKKCNRVLSQLKMPWRFPFSGAGKAFSFWFLDALVENLEQDLWSFLRLVKSGSKSWWINLIIYISLRWELISLFLIVKSRVIKINILSATYGNSSIKGDFSVE